jgi:hypothetical protein
MQLTGRLFLAGRKIAATALALFACAAASANAQDNPCPNPMTGAALSAQFELLSWSETDYVIQNEPGMKKVYDKIPPNYQAQMQADPKAFPWGRVTQNRDQATLDRVAALIHDARLRAVAGMLASLPWKSLQQVLARDSEFQAAAKRPKGTRLEAAASNPKGFDWKALLAGRDTCQLTALKQSAEAAGAKPL